MRTIDLVKIFGMILTVIFVGFLAYRAFKAVKNGDENDRWHMPD